jgi:cytochrome c-type biogenesis protein CcmF
MNLGHISIILAFIASAGAAIFFVLVENQTVKTGWARGLGKRLYWASFGAGLVASIILFNALLTHQYQYAYVAHYTSTDLPIFYLISSFWAGQEGTFLLWAIVVSLMGFVFIRSTKCEDRYAIAIVSGFVGFLYLLIISKSPFDILTPAPADGSGLNPLLQDPWMVIHPPILFVGYAATVFPFALAVSGLMRKKYNNWFTFGLRWTLFAALSLGAGIIIGGFWAYEVLGWGGYWGWDPVENSSLVPWIILLALIHGILIHKSRGSLQRTNLFFAILSFILVLYATFLTRSGILSDFSVHSFGDFGISNYLIGSIVVSIVLGLGLFAVRFSEIKSPKLDSSSFNREITLFISMYVLVAIALFTFVGMSSPIITGLLGKASQVDTSFYNKVNTPVAILMAIFIGISPMLGWSEEKKSGLLKRFSLPLLLAALGCVIGYTAGVHSWILLLFVGSAVFGLVTNVIILFRQYKSGWMNIGGPVAHIGTALMLIGIIGSGKFDESRQVILTQDTPQTIFGYEVTFKGMSDPQALKPVMNIQVVSGRDTFKAEPKLYFSQYNQSIMREPDIKVLALKDLYISPLELKVDEASQLHNPMYEISKGEVSTVGPYQITFERFDVGQHSQTGTMLAGAVLKITLDGKTVEVIPTLTYEGRTPKSTPVDLPIPEGVMNIKPQIAMTAMSVEEKKIVLELIGFNQHMNTTALQQLVVDISIKPLMMVVWTGVVLIILGTLIGWRRRMAQTAS